jgi:hypothetical protein
LRRALAIVCLLASASIASADENDDRYRIAINRQFGYMDHTGRVVIAPRFFWANNFRDGRAHVMICGGDAVIDEDGNIVDPPTLDRLWLQEGLAQFKDKKGKYGYKNQQGKIVIQPKFDEASGFSEGLAPVSVGGKWGFIDKNGEFVLPPTFKAAYRFSDGYARVEDLNAVDHFVDHSFNFKFEKGELAIAFPTEGLMATKVGEKYGYVRADGTWAIEPNFENAQEFSSGLAAASTDGKLLGYIDKSGHFIIPEQFELAMGFSNGLAVVEQHGQRSVIDQEGKIVIGPTDFTWISDFDENGVAGATRESGKGSGYINRTGQIIFWTGDGDLFGHGPLLGWTKREIQESCDGFEKIYPKVLKKALAEAVD